MGVFDRKKKMGMTVVCNVCGYEAATSLPKNALLNKSCTMLRCSGTMKEKK
jgi:hypothetical protein